MFPFAMARMTEEETYTLNDFVTNIEIKLSPNGSGWLTQREMHLLGFSNLTVNYLITKAAAEQKTPNQIIEELVCEKLGATST
jgi:hypothetical protein